MAGLHPSLRWGAGAGAGNHTGPAFYQVMFRSNATPGNIPKITSNYGLTNSLLVDDGSTVTIGAMSITSGGIISFAPGQTFPGDTLVASFNGRTGIVTSAAGDYSFGQISGVATPNQLPAPTAYTDNANTFTLSQTFNSMTVNNGVTNSGTGIKHARVAACNAPGNGTCTTTLAWPGAAFANANYTAACTIDGSTPAAAQLVVVNTSAKTATNMAVRLRALTGTASTGGTINCIAFHD